MRALWLVGLLAASGCHKDRTEVIGPTTPASTAELDALWRLAPEGAKVGVVVSPRGVAMIERAAAAIQALLDAAPELARPRTARTRYSPWAAARWASGTAPAE